MSQKLLMEDDFSKGLENWWTEGAEKIWTVGDALHVKADPPEKGPGCFATVWLRHSLPSDVRIEVECRALESVVNANNMNFFISYADPSGKPLPESAGQRKNAEYQLYHPLNGYIITFLNDNSADTQRHPDGSLKARIRFRRCPGFELMSEKFDYHARMNVDYQVVIEKKGGHLVLTVNGQKLHEHRDPQPWGGGMFGFRTFRTYLTYRKFRVFELG